MKIHLECKIYENWYFSPKKFAFRVPPTETQVTSEGSEARARRASLEQRTFTDEGRREHAGHTLRVTDRTASARFVWCGFECAER